MDYEYLEKQYNLTLEKLKKDLNSKNLLKTDVHVYDENCEYNFNSVSKIIKAPFSYLKTSEFIKAQKQNGATPLTITNKNSGKVCYDLKNLKIDFLTGAEFDCSFFKSEIKFNVLVYGFTEEQENILNKLKRNILKFLNYVNEQNLVAVLSHILNVKDDLDVETFEKLILLFKNFEVLTNSRNSFENFLYLKYIQNITEDYIQELYIKHSINPLEYMKNPSKKILYGGSADSSGIYAGDFGIYFEKTSDSKPYSEQLFEAMQKGKVAPYGILKTKNNDFLSILDYLFGLVINIKDPGLFRVLFYRVSFKEKIAAILIFNFIAEIHRHKLTINYIKAFKNALNGQKVPFNFNFLFSKKSGILQKELNKIALKRNKNSEDKETSILKCIENIYKTLQSELIKTVENIAKNEKNFKNLSPDELLNFIDIPAYIRSINKNNSLPQKLGLGNYLDQLPFEAILYFILLFAYIISEYEKSLNKEIFKKIENESKQIIKRKKVLWVTDSFEEKNGVSECIKSYLKEIRENELDIDILICSDTVEPEKNLLVVKPLIKFELPFYKGNFFKLPDLLEVNKIYDANMYEQIITSTEFSMGFIALLLKHIKKVPVAFFMHTDWIEYSNQSLNLSNRNFIKIKTFIKKFYSQFDKIFVLNSDHKKWMQSFKMKIDKRKVFLTYHWINNKIFYPDKNYVTEKRLKFIFVGRLSEEKGIFVFSDLYKKIERHNLPVDFLVVGVGPDETKLKTLMPNAKFLGWVDHNTLAENYRKSDLLILPNKFDTFGMVILEALSCGCPVAAFSAKGPKEILKNSDAGILADNKKELENKIFALLEDRDKIFKMRNAAIEHSKDFDKDKIFKQFIQDLYV